jgi:hypothetical protein
LPNIDRQLARLKAVRVLANDADHRRSRRHLTRDRHTVRLIVIISASMAAGVAIVVSTPATPMSGAVVAVVVLGPR